MNIDIKIYLITELHRPTRVGFPRRRVLFQANLIEMKAYARINKRHKYIADVINAFTKMTSSRNEVMRASQKVFSK